MIKTSLILISSLVMWSNAQALVDRAVNNPHFLDARSGQSVFELSLFKIPGGRNKSSMLKDFVSYDLKDEADRARLAFDLKNLIQYYKDHQDDPDLGPKHFRISKDIKKSLEYLQTALNQDMTKTVFDKMFEVTDAINLNYRNVNNPQMDITQTVRLALGALNSRLGEKASVDALAQQDFEPLESTFWAKPNEVASVDTSIGMGRDQFPDYRNIVFNYKKPKTGYGTHAGFRVENNSTEYKIRLGSEHRTAPFAARIIHALGFNVLPIDHLENVRIKYDRRLFTEANLRRPIPFELTLGAVKLLTINDMKKIDPFKFIEKAVLKSGEILTSAAFKKKLSPHFNLKHSAEETQYDVAFEDSVSEVIYTQVTVEKIFDHNISVGPWDWDSEVHSQHRELRGYALLAAWLGQYDARTDNTRLYLIKNGKDNYVLRHVMSDVGSALGRANPFFAYGIDDIDRMKTEVLKMTSKGHIKSKKFKTLNINRTFETTTTADARWMFKYIDQLTEKQIKVALAAAGFSPEEQITVFEKLKLRKENIRQVLAN